MVLEPTPPTHCGTRSNARRHINLYDLCTLVSCTRSAANPWRKSKVGDTSRLHPLGKTRNHVQRGKNLYSNTSSTLILVRTTCSSIIRTSTRCFPYFPTHTAAKSAMTLWLRRHAVGKEERGVCFDVDGWMGRPAEFCTAWCCCSSPLVASTSLLASTARVRTFRQAAIRSALAFLTVTDSHR